jgi:hypothetical protein
MAVLADPAQVTGGAWPPGSQPPMTSATRPRTGSARSPPYPPKPTWSWSSARPTPPTLSAWLSSPAAVELRLTGSTAPRIYGPPGSRRSAPSR